MQFRRPPAAALYGRPPRGGRGLKFCFRENIVQNNESPSSRRAWIEIKVRLFSSSLTARRPPRGGRGLKLCGEVLGVLVV